MYTVPMQYIHNTYTVPMTYIQITYTVPLYLDDHERSVGFALIYNQKKGKFNRPLPPHSLSQTNIAGPSMGHVMLLCNSFETRT